MYGSIHNISIHALRGEGDLFTGRTIFSRPWISIHALRGEGDFAVKSDKIQKVKISIHALRGEGDLRVSVDCPNYAKISIHALRGEGDGLCDGLSANDKHFNPRPPWGGRHTWYTLKNGEFVISIHALRGEGDLVNAINDAAGSDFNPRPPWGGRLWCFSRNFCGKGFQSTPSVGRATIAGILAGAADTFQSTPSVGRATISLKSRCAGFCISIHALRGEGD